MATKTKTEDQESATQQSVNDVAIQVLKDNPEGLTKEDLAYEVGNKIGRAINIGSLKLAGLAMDGKIRRERQERRVTVSQVVDVLFAVE